MRYLVLVCHMQARKNTYKNKIHQSLCGYYETKREKGQGFLIPYAVCYICLYEQILCQFVLNIVFNSCFTVS